MAGNYLLVKVKGGRKNLLIMMLPYGLSLLF